MSNISINTESLKDYASEIKKTRNKLENIFNEQNENYEMLTLSSVWASDSEVSCYSKYKELSSQYETILNNLKGYASFIEKAAVSYKNLDDYLSSEEELLPTFDGGGN